MSSALLSRSIAVRSASRSTALAIRAYADAPKPDLATPQNAPNMDIVAPEPREVTSADLISGAPSQLRHRSVRIFQPTRNTMQSGTNKTNLWRIDFDILQGGGRWENPLMGYASSADYMQGTRMSFRSKEDAVHFAEKQGWDYYIQPETVKRVPPKNYAENYTYRATKLRIARTK